MGGHGAKAQPECVHPLHVDRRQWSPELARYLERHRDAAAGNAYDHRLVELERRDRFGQRASSSGAIAEEWRDPGNDAHLSILPRYDGYQPRPAGIGPPKRIKNGGKES